jgi:Uma2 family endonuclease
MRCQAAEFQGAATGGRHALGLEYDFVQRTISMRVETPKKLFTVDDYHRMAEVGILGPEDRVELIEGEIVQVSPIGSRHAATVDGITEMFVPAFLKRAIVRVQGPVRLSNFTEPEPDVILLRYRPDRYKTAMAGPDDTLLVAEVSDTSLRYDQQVKLPIYAAARIPEVWIVNLQDDTLLVFRNPAGRTYATEFALRRGEAISVAAFPETVFQVDEILG